MRFGHSIAIGFVSALAIPATAELQVPLATDHAASGHVQFDHEQVWRLEWVSLGKSVKEEIVDAVELLELDVWRSTPKNIDIRLHPSVLGSLNRFIPANTTFEPFITDLAKAVQHHSLAPPPPDQPWDLDSISSTFHEQYHTLQDLYSFGEALVERFDGVNGIHVQGFTVGQTYEGRDIRGFKAWADPEQEDQEEREFLVQSGSHAREWVGPAAAIYWLHDLLLSADDNPNSDSSKLFRSFTFTVIPTINPDGYAYSQDHHRLWRKNRQDVGSPRCLGLDLNSNWGYKWRQTKSSPCSDAYSGAAPFEAFETRAVADYLARKYSDDGSRPRQLWAFVDLHSYGQLFMFPFAHSCDDFPKDAEMLMEAGLGAAKAMRAAHGEEYQAGQACDLTYRAAGDSIDYAYGVVDARWVYSAELRDTGTYGFLLPPSLIRSSAQESTFGIRYLARFIYNLEIAP